MFTKEELKQQLKQMGILPTDTLMIHTSLRAVGPTEGRGDGLIDAFLEYLTEGLLLIPTHTWASTGRTKVYDARSDETCIGTLPRLAILRKDGFRSLHPTHSMCAFGKGAEEYVRGEENVLSPAPVGGCWDRLGDVKAKILLIGVGYNRNTFIHTVDERLNIPDRLSGSFDVTIYDREGNVLQRTMRAHGSSIGDVSLRYVNFEAPVIALGGQTSGKLGNAEVKIVDAAICREVVTRIYSRADYDVCKEIHTIPEALYM